MATLSCCWDPCVRVQKLCGTTHVGPGDIMADTINEPLSNINCNMNAVADKQALLIYGCRPPQDNPKTLNTQLYIQLYQKKLARFQQFAALYPECYWVFVGDNGQACTAKFCPTFWLHFASDACLLAISLPANAHT